MYLTYEGYRSIEKTEDTIEIVQESINLLNTSMVEFQMKNPDERREAHMGRRGLLKWHNTMTMC